MTWYIAITNPNCHRRAENGLAELGYRAFWPKLKKWVSHARTKVPKEYPILGRYLFVEILAKPGEDGPNFWTVRNVHGVDGFLTDETGRPAEVNELVVWRLRERYMRGEWDFVSNRTGEFINEKGQPEIRVNPIPTGARVQIMEGEFEGLITIVRGRNSNGKLEFLPRGGSQFKYTRESNVRAA